MQGVAISSYQGGHVEYFEYLVERLPRARRRARQGLRRRRRRHRPGRDRAAARERGVHDLLARGRPAARPAGHGQHDDPRLRRRPLAERGRSPSTDGARRRPRGARPRDHRRSRTGAADATERDASRRRRRGRPGARHHRHRRLRQVARSPTSWSAGFRLDQQDKLRIAVLAVDPTRRKGGGALLGDRIRMNALDGDRQIVLPLAGHPRRAASCPSSLDDVIAVAARRPASTWSSSRRPASARATPRSCRSSTSSLYVMTPEFGAASQLEKIDMLDFADVVAINKFERRGAEDALRDVAPPARPQPRGVRRSEPEDMPVFGTSRGHVQRRRRHRAVPAPRATCSPDKGLPVDDGRAAARRRRRPSDADPPRSSRPARVRYLAEIARDGPRLPRRDRARWPSRPAAGAARWTLVAAELPAARGRIARCSRRRAATARRRCRRSSTRGRRRRGVLAATSTSSPCAARRSAPPLTRESLSRQRRSRGSRCPATPTTASCCAACARENLPGSFPFTAGVFPFKRDDEDPARMFAGEGDPFRTNRRFKLLSAEAAGDPPVDRVRLGDAVRPRPRPAARHLRQGRHLGRVDRDARRHEGALRRVRPARRRPRRCR